LQSSSSGTTVSQQPPPLVLKPPTSELPASPPPPPEKPYFDPLHGSSPPPSPPDPEPESDNSDDDNDMSKALKAFGKVTLLKGDELNWDTWSSRAKRVAVSIGFKKYLEWSDNTEKLEAETKENNDLLNAMIGRLSDSIFWRYKKLTTSKQLWSALKKDYDSKNALTEAYLQC
jgi:hypothetical protein